MSSKHQRVGSISNAHVGAALEQVALEYFESIGLSLFLNHKVSVGLHSTKEHAFDLGSEDPKILVECKSHKWTKGGKVPSAKMTTWNEAMYYFHLAPEGYRKIFFVLHHRRNEDGESLVSYYHRIYSHFIPEDVEFVEWDEANNQMISQQTKLQNKAQ